jgi:hypothetical protein
LHYGYWPWEQKLSKKQEIVQYRNYALYWMLCRYIYAIWSPVNLRGDHRHNIRRGTFAVKTNGYKTKLYCNIYTTGIDVNQNYMVNSNNLFCSLYKNSSLPISDKWTPSLKKVPLHPKLTRVTLHKHLPVEYKARQQNSMPYYCYCNAKNLQGLLWLEIFAEKSLVPITVIQSWLRHVAASASLSDY